MVIQLPDSQPEHILRPPGEIKMETNDLDMYYGNFQALKNVTLAMPSRRIT
ncbi:unnamed protein product, partial [marine sediment metagenome]